MFSNHYTNYHQKIKNKRKKSPQNHITKKKKTQTAAMRKQNTSIHHSIRCALALADYIGEAQPEWEVAVGRLGHAIVAHPGSFVPKDRHAMEWYYPVLCGAIRGPAAHTRIHGEKWNLTSIRESCPLRF